MNDVEAAVHLVSTAKVYKNIFKGDVEHILQQVLPPIKLTFSLYFIPLIVLVTKYPCLKTMHG